MLKTENDFKSEFARRPDLRARFKTPESFTKFALLDQCTRENLRPEWDRDILLREEFAGNFESFYHFKRAEINGQTTASGKTRGPCTNSIAAGRDV